MSRWVYGLIVAVALVAAYWLGTQGGHASTRTGDPEESAPAARSHASLSGDVDADPSAFPQAAPAPDIGAMREAPPRAGASAVAARPGSIAGSFLTRGFLNSRATASVDAADFGKLIAQARREADAESLRMTESYRRILGTGLAGIAGEPRVDDMACTGRVCLLAVSRRDAQSSQLDWMEMLGEATAGTSLKVGALVEGATVLPGGRVETRVVFATGTSGIIAGPPRR